jgi:hypothetical protein
MGEGLTGACRWLGLWSLPCLLRSGGGNVSRSAGVLWRSVLAPPHEPECTFLVKAVRAGAICLGLFRMFLVVKWQWFLRRAGVQPVWNTQFLLAVSIQHGRFSPWKSCARYGLILYVSFRGTWCAKAVPWLRRSVAGLLSRSPGFDSGAIYVKLCCT